MTYFLFSADHPVKRTVSDSKCRRIFKGL